MKKTLFILLSIVLLSCSTEKKEIVHKIVLKNTTSLVRTAEPIVISQEKIDAVLGTSLVTGSVYFENSTGEKIPFQKDDFTGISEYSLSIDFNANETKEIHIKITDADQKIEFTPYTNVRLGKDANADGTFDDIEEELREPNRLPGLMPVLYQTEGISWENDKVGFRTYWDKRNGKDIWGKITDRMVMDSVGLPNTPSYHELQPWGADILKVGSSLGAGALAMKKNGKLVRLGDTKKASFKVLTEGPVRTVFTLNYQGWEVDGETFDITEKISIWKGKYGYKSDVTLKGSNQKIVTGIVNINLKKDSLFTVEPNKNRTIIYTFDKQTEVDDILGMALILKTKEFKEVNAAPNVGTGRSIDGNSPISHTYYAELEDESNKVSFYFFAGWEQTNSAFKIQKGFEDMLVNEANKLDNPIIIE
ncbi:MAG: hypothetical protein DRJ07_07140 [Bacteroidetes bacterium]|nr:MAG: hypothetical protein DRJ07_07140 [Bacteroidota bacterium]